MYVDVVPNRKSPPAVLLRESFREGKAIRKRTLANLTDWEPAKVALLRRVLAGETLVSPEQAFVVERSVPHGHVAAVLGTLRQLGVDRLLASRPSRERDLVVAMIVARILDPASKLATARGLDAPTSTLAETLGVSQIDEDDLYGALDWLLARQAKIEVALARRHLAEGTLVLYDVTSTYFEGRSCPLGRLGYSRDGKRDRLQVVFGLMTDPMGRPVAVEVFEGQTADPKTLAVQVAKLRERFGLRRVVLVGDRGMITDARIREDLQHHDGLDWITALRSPAIRKLLDSGTIQLSLFDDRGLVEITTEEYPDERLIVCKNPLLAAERARKREDLLKATERDLDLIVTATRRERQPLRGRDQIALRVGRVLGRFKVGKHFLLTIAEESFRYERDAQAIELEAQLDGIYVIRTNLAPERLGAEATVKAYKSLARVEQSFRTLKTVDLNVRPIYHRLGDRVRAHVLLCMLAYYVEWHLRDRLAPLLFQDDDRVGAEARRDSVVHRARRSLRAETKASRKRTEDGLPVHSFRSLLAVLATLCKNHVACPSAGGAAFDQYTAPDVLQQRAFDLLGLIPANVASN